jgi:uncharacterized membrane-anchored protein
MTNREDNTNAPKVGTHEVQAEDLSGSAPRRVEDVRKDREAERHRREEELGTSWVSVVLGWLAALGAGLILSGIVSGIVGAIFGTAGSQGIVEGGTTALIGLLVTLLLAFLIGGYVAGRLASRQGLKHGILVPLLALVVTIVLAIAGGLVGVSFIDQLSGVTLPQGAQQSAQQATPRQGLGTILTVSGILALLFPFIGGAIGGLWGARTGRRRP